MSCSIDIDTIDEARTGEIEPSAPTRIMARTKTLIFMADTL